MIKYAKYFILSFITLIFISCENSVEPHDYSIPIFHSLRVSNPEIVYNDEPLIIKFLVPKTSKVILWVTKAFGPQDDIPNSILIAYGMFIQPMNTPIVTLVNETVRGGYYAVHWNWRSPPFDTLKNNIPLPPGFYRYYLKIGDSLLWKDFLLLNR